MSNGRSRRVGSLAGLECPLPLVRGDPSLIAVGSHVSEQSLSGSRTQLDLQLQPRWRDGGWGDAGEESKLANVRMPKQAKVKKAACKVE